MPFSRSSFSVDADKRELLEQWSVAHNTPQQVAKRCRIILLEEEGWSDRRIAEKLDINRHTCRLWRRRFAEKGAESLWEVAEGRGRKPRTGLAQKIVEATLRTKPEGETQWSTRSLGQYLFSEGGEFCGILGITIDTVGTV